MIEDERFKALVFQVKNRGPPICFTYAKSSNFHADDSNWVKLLRIIMKKKLWQKMLYVLISMKKNGPLKEKKKNGQGTDKQLLNLSN